MLGKERTSLLIDTVKMDTSARGIDTTSGLSYLFPLIVLMTAQCQFSVPSSHHCKQGKEV